MSAINIEKFVDIIQVIKSRTVILRTDNTITKRKRTKNIDCQNTAQEA